MSTTDETPVDAPEHTAPIVESAADILDAADDHSELIYVPEWDRRIWVRSMSGTERDKFETSMVGKNGKADVSRMAHMRARMVAATAVDKNGDPLFAQNQIEKLSAKNAAALDRLFTAARRLSGLTDQDVEEIAGE